MFFYNGLKLRGCNLLILMVSPKIGKAHNECDSFEIFFEKLLRELLATFPRTKACISPRILEYTSTNKIVACMKVSLATSSGEEEIRIALDC